MMHVTEHFMWTVWTWNSIWFLKKNGIAMIVRNAWVVSKKWTILIQIVNNICFRINIYCVNYVWSKLIIRIIVQCVSRSFRVKVVGISCFVINVSYGHMPIARALIKRILTNLMRILSMNAGFVGSNKI